MSTDRSDDNCHLIDNNKDPILISIGMPVYNGEKYLSEAIESLLSQTYTNFELIISDNASNDHTSIIAKQYQRQDQRIRYIRQEKNIGAGRNFLFVMREAKGRFFMWAAHDDIWSKNWLEILIQNISSEDIGIRGKIILYRNHSVIAEKIPPNYRARDFTKCFLANETNYRSHYTYSLFFREKLLAVDLTCLSIDYYPDAIFIYNLLHKGALRTIQDTCMFYRLHNLNLGAEYSNKWKGWKKILYRIHPFRYYLSYLRYSERVSTKLLIALLIPIKHLYSQSSFWFRGLREILTRKKFI